MKHNGLIIGLALLLLVGWAQESPPLSIQVVDEAGNPIPNASVAVSIWDSRRYQLDFVSEPLFQRTDTNGNLSLRWAPESASRVSEILVGERGGYATLWVWASGYVAKQVTLRYPETEKPQTITLRKGRAVELQLTRANGESLPDDFGTQFRAKTASFRSVADIGRLSADLTLLATATTITPFDIETRPEIRQSTFGSAIFLPSLFVGFGIEAQGEGRYRCSLPDDLSSLTIAIDRPGIVRGYLHTIESQELSKGTVRLTLPKPGRLTVEADLTELRAQNDSTPMPIAIVRWLASGLYALVETRTVSGERETFQIDDVAPGDGWYLSVRKIESDRQSYFEDVSAPVQVAEGGEARIEWRYVPADPERYKGTRTVEVVIRNPEGKPYANQPYRLMLYLPSHGQSFPVAEGRLDSEGRAKLTNLYENPAHRANLSRWAVEYFIILGEDEYRGNEYRLTLYEGDGIERLEFAPSVALGDFAPDVALYDLDTGETRKLSEFRGTWVLLDFWATWCGPCHSALDKLKRLLEERGEQWRDRLQVITVSIDDESNGVPEFLKRRGWWEMARHFWAGGDWSSPTAKAFGIKSIPTMFLIDPEGRVVWSSQTARMSVETVLEQYLIE